MRFVADDDRLEYEKPIDAREDRQNPEMGQGVKTALAVIIVGELDVDWEPDKNFTN